MDIWQLKIFVAVVEEKSFSKASLRINLSQPTVSSHIKELEDYFQCRLLDRLGKKTEPTRAGRILYSHARELLALRDRTEAAMRDFLGRTKGTLVIGGSTIPSGYIIPRLLGPFAKSFPDVSVSLITGDTSQVIEDVKQGRVELGVVGARTSDPAIVQEKLVEDELKLIVPAGHKWAGRSAVDCGELWGEPFIAREQGSGTWQSICGSMDAAGFNAGDLNTCVTFGNSVSVIQGILHQVGISILSVIAVADEIEKGRLAALSVNGLDLGRHFYLTLAKRRAASPICKKFLRFAKERIRKTGNR